jgi:hypothetical protein
VVIFREAPVIGKVITPMLDGIYYIPKKALEYFLKFTGRDGIAPAPSMGLIPNRFGGHYTAEQSDLIRKLDREHIARMNKLNSETNIN